MHELLVSVSNDSKASVVSSPRTGVCGQVSRRVEYIRVFNDAQQARKSYAREVTQL